MHRFVCAILPWTPIYIYQYIQVYMLITLFKYPDFLKLHHKNKQKKNHSTFPVSGIFLLQRRLSPISPRRGVAVLATVYQDTDYHGSGEEAAVRTRITACRAQRAEEAPPWRSPKDSRSKSKLSMAGLLEPKVWMFWGWNKIFRQVRIFGSWSWKNLVGEHM